MPDINIDNVEYTIEINPQNEYVINLNEQGPQGLRGFTGNGIESYVKTSSSGLTDTYTITFTDGEIKLINVTNGRGISSITGPVSVGLVDTYTINYNDGTTSTFDVTNGNGIASITKTGTVGLVDTYTILYTDGTSTTFTVTNGQNGSGSVADVLVNGTSVLDGQDAKILIKTINSNSITGSGNLDVGTVTSVNNVTPISGDVTLTASDIGALSDNTKYGADLSYNSNTLQLLDQDGNSLGNSVTIQSSPDIDNKSITTNTSDELQTVGVIDSNNTTNAIKTWVGTKAQYDAITTKDNTTMYYLTDAHAIYLGDTLVVNLANRNIGEIVASTIPLTDAGLHLLDGTLLPYGVYKEFIDYIADLYAENPSANYFTTEALWQQSVTTYGVCGKFVYDNVNNTVRLPKVTGIIEGTTDVTALGDLVKAGLPNITGEFHVTTDNAPFGNGSGSGAFKEGSTSSLKAPSNSGSSYQMTKSMTFDALRSNPTYGNSTTVQPQTIKCYYYIVIATSTKTDIQVDIDNIATDLNGKADVDLTNVPSSKGILQESYINGTSWYRVYSDGWCEQGGRCNGVAYNSGTKNVTFLKPFKDTNYFAVASPITDASNDGNWSISCRVAGFTTTNMTVRGGINGNGAWTYLCDWYACGYIN